MKFLFDFDGVLTEQTEEALRVREIFRDAIARIGRTSVESAERLVARGEAEMEKAPTRHGWKMHGRVTAFANEDLFIRNNGLAAHFDEAAAAGDAELAELLTRARAEGFKDFYALAQQAYLDMVEETRSGKMKPTDPETGPLLNGLVRAGHEVVIVSNSGTDRILNLLERAGVPGQAHTAHPTARLRVRGDARKFELAENPDSFLVDGYAVEVARPVYENILREEKPDAVIGDVFSLDLALPLQLSRRVPESFRGIRLYLRTRDYTPAWSKRYFSRSEAPTAQLRLLADLRGLAEFTG
jgi:phosphoglycolate phosphatase-like HAD superfamily hydrolase